MNHDSMQFYQVQSLKSLIVTTCANLYINIWTVEYISIAIKPAENADWLILEQMEIFSILYPRTFMGYIYLF